MSGLDLGTRRRGGISNLLYSEVFSRNRASAGEGGVLFGSNLSGWGSGSESLWGEGEGGGGGGARGLERPEKGVLGILY